MSYNFSQVLIFLLIFLHIISQNIVPKNPPLLIYVFKASNKILQNFLVLCILEAVFHLHMIDCHKICHAIFQRILFQFWMEENREKFLQNAIEVKCDQLQKLFSSLLRSNKFPVQGT